MLFLFQGQNDGFFNFMKRPAEIDPPVMILTPPPRVIVVDLNILSQWELNYSHVGVALTQQASPFSSEGLMKEWLNTQLIILYSHTQELY